jgi:hypothetical protein
MQKTASVGILLFAVLLGRCFASGVRFPVHAYEVRVQTEVDIIMVKFTTEDGTMTLTLPSDLVAGETVTGTIIPSRSGSTGQYQYRFELNGQFAAVGPDPSAPWKGATFHWKIPTAGDGVNVITVRDWHFDTRGYVALPIMIKAPVQPEADESKRYVLPKVIQTGEPFPVLGHFDGAQHIKIKLGGQSLEPVAVSPRRAVFVCPENIDGVFNYELQAGAEKESGSMRAVSVELHPGKKKTKNQRSVIARFSGLSDLQYDIPIRFENQWPPTWTEQDYRSEVPPGYHYVTRKEVRKDGTFELKLWLSGYGEGAEGLRALVVIPEGPLDETREILRQPRSNYSTLPEQEHAAEMVKRFGDEAMPLLAAVLPELQYEAFTTMMRLDQKRAIPFIVKALPELGGQPLGMALTAVAAEAGSPDFAYRREFHDYLAQRLAENPGVLTVEAFAAVAMDQDKPLLESIYSQSQPQVIGAALSMHDAAEAVLARLGSPQHVANIKAELEKAAPLRPTFQEAAALQQLFMKAELSRRKDLLPLLCRHIGDPGWWDTDYGVAPSGFAAQAVWTLGECARTHLDVAAVCKEQQ